MVAVSNINSKREITNNPEPSRGTKPICQYHQRDKYKILPHIRHGININK